VDLQGRGRVKTSVSLQQTPSFGAICPNLLHKQQHVDNAVPKMQFPLFPCSVLQQGLRSLNAVSLLVTGLESTRSLFPSQGCASGKGSANKRCNSSPPSPIPSHHLPSSSHHFINVPGDSSFLTPSTQHPSLQSSPQQVNSTEPLNASRWLKREKRERQRRPVAQSPLNLRPI
jgi:hypothetical protein